jgi:hypothetical protein
VTLDLVAFRNLIGWGGSKCIYMYEFNLDQLIDLDIKKLNLFGVLSMV